jgi:hypothetical protein
VRNGEGSAQLELDQRRCVIRNRAILGLGVRVVDDAVWEGKLMDIGSRHGVSSLINE